MTGRVIVASPAPSSAAAPLRRARIRLDGGTVTTQFTDSDTNGAYRFDRLPAGRYTISAEKPGELPGDRTACRSGDGVAGSRVLRADPIRGDRRHAA
ncbi:MAG: carboxypeptidase regulatory-like domain-containing protein [Acidobacteria bacterium]|nr:carboxypeptidase regulatory-like domain-containing protein [Acidobacteriota bacterium]